jgi:2',3'-cyclic-nucleotide 2'-phosphodiesterase (5'-nucleotidase family)
MLLCFFSGDSFNLSMMSTITSDAQKPPVAAQVAASCVGHHDLDFGLDRLVELAKACNVPWLMANMLLSKTQNLFLQCKR